jgi:hypothetical protein
MLKYLFFLFASLSALQIELGDAVLQVELADTPEAWRIGLSGRSELPENQGMLFVFKEPHILSFWMKDTTIPLSIGFFDANRVLLQIEEMNPPFQDSKKLPIYKSDRPALYALEVSQGWFKRHQIKPGMRFSARKNAFPDQTNPIR